MKKICSMCGQEKDLEEYHRDARLKCGRVSRCKACMKIVRKKSYAARVDKEREYHDRYYAKNKKRILARKKEGWNGGKTLKQFRKYYAKNKHKEKARYITYQATVKGEIPPASARVCTDCNSQAEHYHHEDYSRPMDVIPLCRPCHDKRHRTVQRVCQQP